MNIKLKLIFVDEKNSEPLYQKDFGELVSSGMPLEIRVPVRMVPEGFLIPVQMYVDGVIIVPSI
jgi:hypothetical protein